MAFESSIRGRKPGSPSSSSQTSHHSLCVKPIFRDSAIFRLCWNEYGWFRTGLDLCL